MTETDRETELEALLRAARDAGAPSDALMARVLADAAAVQAARQPAAALPERQGPAGRQARGMRWLSLIGGWRGAGGLVAATVTGLMVGLYAPGSIDLLLSGQLTELGLIGEDPVLSSWGAGLEFEES